MFVEMTHTHTHIRAHYNRKLPFCSTLNQNSLPNNKINFNTLVFYSNKVFLRIVIITKHSGRFRPFCKLFLRRLFRLGRTLHTHKFSGTQERVIWKVGRSDLRCVKAGEPRYVSEEKRQLSWGNPLGLGFWLGSFLSRASICSDSVTLYLRKIRFFDTLVTHDIRLR